MKHFSAPKSSLGRLEPEAAATLVAAASDIALVLDREGIIRDISFNSDELASELAGHAGWIGRPWIDTVTIESRSKVQALLGEARSDGAAKARQVNHPSSRRQDVPILYSVVLIGRDGRIVAFGRDLQPISQLQHRLVEAQQLLERDYSRLRHVETRYRLLFQLSAEPVIIVDAASEKVIEANPAAGDLFGDAAKRAIGRPFPDIFDAESAAPVRALLGAIRAAGRADDVRARLAGHKEELLVSSSIFRQDGSALFLIRLTRISGATDVPKMTWKLLKLVENAPDGFVVTNSEGRILSANAAFLGMAQLASDHQSRNEPLDRWLGRPGVDLNVLISNLQRNGSIRLFASTLRGEFGTTTEVEISAASVMNSEKQCFGFAIRNVGRRLKSDSRPGPELPRSVAQLTELVGRVSLKDLVREATDLIERLSIEAALQMTSDNRASAAEMLGLSRQSLYVKLRRYGLAEPAAEIDDDTH